MLAFVFFKVNVKSEIDPIFLVSGVIKHVITKNTLVAICNHFTFGELQQLCVFLLIQMFSYDLLTSLVKLLYIYIYIYIYILF